MSLLNPYLRETPLTSTRNKYLEECVLLRGLDNELTNTYNRKGILSNLFDFSDKSLLSTENKFLISDLTVQAKKKKKYKQHCIHHSADVPQFSDESLRSLNDEFHDFQNIKGTENPPLVFGSGPVFTEFSASTNNIPFGSTCASTQGFSMPENVCFGSASKTLSKVATSFRSSNVPTSGIPSSLFSDNFNIPETVIYEMPSYNLETIQLQLQSEHDFQSDFESLHHSDKSGYNIKSKKLQLLNVVSMALMYSSNLKDDTDVYRKALIEIVAEVRMVDPEFILKVALYARQELQIRTVTNFLLAYSALHPNTRIFLEKYFSASIVLPTDWTQVADYFQILNDGSKKQNFPAALRRAMKNSFTKFDEYQLAKYNRSKSKRKKLNNKVSLKNGTDDSINDSKIKNFTLKELVRILHIDSPAEHVMCLLGKKYPESHQSFQLCKLPGTWDPSKAGIRMKLPIPETWETQLPAKGNKPNVWESLIDNKKLPYMAMLRNLRNLILSGISNAHHKKVISYLENKKNIINSRQLPLQFYEAFKAVSNLKNMIEANTNADSVEMLAAKVPPLKKNKIIKNVSVTVVEQYMSAISTALEISSFNNLHPIPGKTLIILELTYSKGMKKKLEMCIMMGLMCLKACENCKLHIIIDSSVTEEITFNDNKNFLSFMKDTCKAYKEKCKIFRFAEEDDERHALEKVLDYYLKSQTILSLKLDHIVFMRCSDNIEKVIMKSFLNKYRQIVNSDLLYTNVNFNLDNKSFTESCSSEKDMYLCGSSSPLIKFIAERSSGGQLTCVENVDIKYKLPEIKTFVETNAFTLPETEKSLVLNYRVPKWHTVRIFVSSTFKDMISERDLLMQYVFPELKKRANSVFVRILEVDLRWGITESDSSTKRAAELCLLEAQKSDLFVGMIGNRYGTIYNFDAPNAPELEWFKNCPAGLSITELEIHAAALNNPVSSRKKAFFYFRDNSFLKHVPHKWLSHFESEDLNAACKLEQLKNKIKSNGFKVLDGYPCSWAGIFENKPILTGLDTLAATMLDDLWKAVQEIHTKDPFFDKISEEEMYQQNVIDSHSSFAGKKNSCLDSVLKHIKTNCGTVVICGSAGSGKTTLMVNLLKSLKNYIVVKFFIGFSPMSQNLSYLLQCICNSFVHQLPVPVKVPDFPDDIVNQFPDIIIEASTCTGGKQMILLIDGLEHLDKNDQNLDWLPLMIPNRVKFVCSAADTSLAFKVLCERQERGYPVSVEIVSPLQQVEREELVRNYLSLYRKTLDESAFSNNMRKIVTKKESSNPLYLRVACDFLRLYASFENLMHMLQKLPSTVVLVFQEVILQLENEFGTTLVQNALTLLCTTREGLEDNDIYNILSFLTSVHELKTTLTFEKLTEKIMAVRPEELLSQVKYCSLMHVLNTFACGQTRQTSISLCDTLFEKSIEKFYMNKNYSILSKYMHCILSAYYYNICDPGNDKMYSGHSAVALRGMLYHMCNGCLCKELSELLCDYNFIEAIFREKVSDQLLEYYSLLLFHIFPSNQKLSREINYHHLNSFYDFVSRNFHIFHKYSFLVKQQALNEPPDSFVTLKNEKCTYDSLENLSRSALSDYRLATINGFVKNITTLTSEKVKPFVLLGSEDGYLKILDLNSRKIIRNIKGHTSAVTFICHAGKNRICISSNDGTLTLWDNVDFTQVAVLKGHRHNVTGCCSDPAGSILFSTGWDNSVRLWSVGDGRSISTIDSFRCPVNCIDHHPLKQQIACGLWNGNIEIWDTLSIEKKLEISSSFGSVRSIAYTTDGFNIITSFIQSEICIWSSEEGHLISNLKGHILPVNAISCSSAENLFVSGSDDCSIKVWSSTSEPYFCIISKCKNSPVCLIEFMSKDILAVALQNSEIWTFDINSGDLTAKFSLESDIVSNFSTYSKVTFKPATEENLWFETTLVFGTNTGKLMVGNIHTLSVSTVGKLESKITSSIHNDSGIICGTAEGDIGIFSYPDPMQCKILTSAHRAFITSFCLAASNEFFYVLSTSNDNMLKFWRIDINDLNVTLHKELSNKHRDSITCSTFYPPVYYEDSPFCEFYNLYTGSYDNNIVCNALDLRIFKGLKSSVLKVECSENFVLGCGNDGSMVLWNSDGEILTSVAGIEMSSTPLTFFISENESKKFEAYFAFVDKDGSIKIRKPFERTFSCSLEGHRKAITSCCITENAEVVSCSLDGSVNIWKLPIDYADNSLIHNSPITGLLLSPDCKLALSSDAQGNLVVWNVCSGQVLPLVYATKKSYASGFIKKISWMKNNCFVCAVNQSISEEEKYFIDILRFEQTSVLSLKIIKSYNFLSEILCLDSCSVTGTIVVGFKSGQVLCITSDSQRTLKISGDWILGVSLYSRENPSDLICTSFVNGSVNLYSLQEFLKAKDLPDLTPFACYKPPQNSSLKLITVLNCGIDKNVLCGDIHGNIRIYSHHALKLSKKIHADSITGICVVGTYIFTSSLDRTVKGWNITSLKQVCQFHLHVPITGIVAPAAKSDLTTFPNLLLIGTSSGDVHLLQFHCK